MSKKLKEIILINSWGERVIIYNLDNKWKRGIYILIIKEKDGGNDKSLKLNRVNLGVY